MGKILYDKHVIVFVIVVDNNNENNNNKNNATNNKKTHEPLTITITIRRIIRYIIGKHMSL